MTSTILIEKRKHILWLQWLLIIAISYLIHFNSPTPYEFTYLDFIIVVLIVLNSTLFFIPRSWFQGSGIDFALVFVDIVFVSTAIYLTEATSDLYLFFFLILMMAAAGQNLRALILGVLTISGLYALMIYKMGGFSFTSGFLLRIPFLFIVGLFFGYLVYVQKVGQERLQAESEFTVDLFEFGKALVQAEDLQSLYLRVPQLINDIMMTNGCELAIINDGAIVQRVFDGLKVKGNPVMAISESIHSTAFQSPGTIFSSDALQSDPRFTSKRDFNFYPTNCRHYMAKSWRPDNRPSGVIAAYRTNEAGWTAQDQKKFQFLTDQTVLALQYVDLMKELEAQARTDGLTGLANYRYFAEKLEEEISRARRSQIPFSLMLMDVDNFKLINDNWGHDKGDEILRRLAMALKNTTGTVDTPARRGGDEFVVLLPNTDWEEARSRCQRLIEEVRAISSNGSEEDSFSISVGCATFPDNGRTVPEILERADEALYFAKAQGRGCAWHYAEVLKTT